LVMGFDWLADAWLEKCELGNAYKFREQSVELRQELARENPDEPKQREVLAFSLTGLAGVQQQIGLNEAAILSFEEALEILQKLQAEEPGNTELEWELLYRTARLARHLQAMGRSEDAWAITQRIADRLFSIVEASDGSDQILSVEGAFFQVDYGRLLLEQGKTESGKNHIRAATEILAELVRQKPGFKESLVGLAYAYFEYWKHVGAADAPEIRSLLDEYLSDPTQVENCSDANRAARLAVIDGNEDLARRYTDYVLGKGYFEAGFTSFCKEYKLCDLP